MKKSYIYCKHCKKLSLWGEHCEHCNSSLSSINKSKVSIIIDKSNPHWSHALGRVVKNNSEERREAKRKGLVEVGRDNPAKNIKQKRKEYTW